MPDVTVEIELVFGVDVIRQIVFHVGIGHPLKGGANADPTRQTSSPITVMGRFGKTEIEFDVIANAHKQNPFTFLRHTIVGDIEEAALHLIAKVPHVIKNPFVHLAAGEMQNALDIFGEKEQRSFVFHDTQQLQVELVALIGFVPLRVGNGKTLTGEPADHDVAVRDLLAGDCGNVGADDVISEIGPIGLHGIGVKIVRPDDLVTRTNKTKVKTACAAEKGDDFHTTNTFPNRMSSSPRDLANLTGTALPI